MKSRISTWTANLGCTMMIIGIGVFILATLAINIQAGLILLAIFFFMAIIIFGVSSSIEKGNKERMKKYIETISPLSAHFHETQSYTSFDAINKIAIDETNQLVCIWQPANEVKKYDKKMKYEVYEYPYSDILAVEISENGYPIGTIKRTSKSAQHLLDGLLSEDNGIIIGGHQVGDKDSKTITSMELKIIVKDISKPLHLIRFFQFTTGEGTLKKYKPEYQKYLQQLRHWYMLLNLMIKQADHMNADTEDQTTTQHISVNVEPEIDSLNEEKEVLTKTFIKTVDHQETSTFHFDEIIKTPESYTFTTEEEKEVELEVNDFKDETENSLSEFEKLLEENKRKQLGLK